MNQITTDHTQNSDYTAVTFFNPRTGEILKNYYGPTSTLHEVADLEMLPFIYGHCDGSTHCINDPSSIDPKPAVRQWQPVNQNAETIKAGETLALTKLPCPCTVYIAGRSYKVTDGSLFWSTPLIGVYDIRITAFPYHDWTGKVTVVEGG